MSADVTPLRSPRWHMTGLTIHLVIFRSRFQWISLIEPRPAPAVTPQFIAGMVVLAVPHHYKPALQFAGMAHPACGHFAGCFFKYFLHQHRAVGEMPVLLIRGDRTWRSNDTW